MAFLTDRFSKVQLLLAAVSAVGFIVGTAPVGYTQDVPTPTPPAGEGEFEGAPDPTPDPELEPEAPVEPLPETDGAETTPDTDSASPASEPPTEPTGGEPIESPAESPVSITAKKRVTDLIEISMIS